MASGTEPSDLLDITQALATTTPAELANDIRSAARDVYTYAQAWRRSSDWSGDTADRKAFETIVLVRANLDATPDPTTHSEVGRLVDAVAPILSLWWADSPGPKHDLVAAIERLRKAGMWRVARVQQARQSLGLT